MTTRVITPSDPKDAGQGQSAPAMALKVVPRDFDYTRGAELFPARPRKPKRQPFGYRRFSTASDAIRFAIEELPPLFLVGAYLEVDEERYDSAGIRRLYDHGDYPLARQAAA